MVVKIYESQIQNASSTEYQINQFLEENPNLEIAQIAVSQGQDSGDHGCYIVVVNFTERK